MKRIWLSVSVLLLVWALWMGVSLASAADTYPILGAVMLADGRAVEGAVIYVDGVPMAQTDLAGMYMAPAVSAGRHLVQPVKAGMTFVPASVEVTLPPEAVGINFTAYAAGGAIDSTSELESVSLEKTPWQELWGTLERLSRGIQQLTILMLVLSLGAFMALTARRLRSGEWSLAVLFQPSGSPAGQAAGTAEADNGWEMLDEADERSAGEASSMPEEASFEVVSAVSATEPAQPDLTPARQAEPEPLVVEPVEAEPGAAEPAEAVEPEQAPAAAAEPEPAPQEPSQAPQVPAPHHPEGHLRVRRYPGDSAAQPASAMAEPVQVPSLDLLRQGMKLVRAGDYAGGEALLRQVVQHAPGNADAWLWLGAARLNQGDARTAKGCFLQAQRLGHPQADAALKRV